MKRVISMFAGIGGFDLAFTDAGFSVIWANECDKWAIKTYRANFPNVNLIEGDIRKINAQDIPEHDILTAGFPCQPWSTANQGNEQGLKDPRGHLFKEIVRVLEYHKPTYFLLENVKGLISKKNKEAFNLIISELERLGYKVSYKVLNAKHYGVPQNRERVFIIGNLLGLDFEWPEPTNEPVKISDILEDHPESKYYLSEKAWEGLKKHKERNQENGNGYGYTAFNPEDKATNTIRARYYKDGQEILISPRVDKKYYISKEKWEAMLKKQWKQSGSNKTTFDFKEKYGNSDNILFQSKWTQHIASEQLNKERLSPTITASTTDTPFIFNETRKRGVFKPSKDNLAPTLRAAMGMGGGTIPIINRSRTILGGTGSPVVFQYRDRKDPNRNNIEYVNDKIAPTLTEAMGAGGGHIPLIFQNRRRSARTNKENISPTLTGNMGTGGNNQPFILQPERIGTVGADRQGYRVYSPDNIGVAVKSNQGGIFANTEGYLINNRPRRLTPRECLRLQGFNDNFKIVVSDTQIYKQAGNAVAVPVVGAIAQEIKRQWINHKHTR